MRLALAASIGSSWAAADLFGPEGMPSIELLVAVGVVLAAVAGLVALWIAKHVFVVCPPNGLLVLSGRRQRAPDGGVRGFRIITEGLAIRIPILEQAAVLDRSVLPLAAELRNALAKNGQSLTIHFTACVRVAGDEPRASAAVERFLGRDRREIGAVARETLESVLRRVVSASDAETLLPDRERFAQLVAEGAREDLDRLGLELRNLQLQEIVQGRGAIG